ncbi:MAG TPA: phosphoethanolamine transferase [Phnomibacter sp.]|nr:phosphoethanolamine transferase [Phnomibacter sp.]
MQVRSNRSALVDLFSTHTLRILLCVLLPVLLIYSPDAAYFLRNGVFNYLVIGFVVVTIFLCIPVVLFARRMKWYYLLLSFIAALSPIGIFPVLLINSQANTEMIGLLMDTNWQEVKELLGWRILLLILSCALFFYVSKKLLYRLPAQLSYKRAGTISAIAIALTLLLPFSRSRDLFFYQQILINTSKTFYPFRIGNAVSFVYNESQNEQRHIESTRNFSFGAKKSADFKGPSIHLLLIGETARGDHFSINGYHRPTNPLLAQQANLVSFPNAISGASMTHLSVPLIISRADAREYDKHKAERSIVYAFKEAGFYTAWISNQAKHGLTSSIAMHYPDADTTIFHGWGSNETNFTGSTDAALLPTLSQVLKANNGKDIFIVMHMIGSHWRYLLRYPESFTKFKPVSERNRAMVGYPPKDVVMNEYDNSILYTDYILNEIINLVKATSLPASITYVSDHGENLGDDERNLFFHAYKPTRPSINIPMLIWYSDQFLPSGPIWLQH